LVAEFGEVAAALAGIAPPAEPSARLGERILSVTRADPGEPGGAASPPASPGTPVPGPSGEGEGTTAPGTAGPGTAGAPAQGTAGPGTTGSATAGPGEGTPAPGTAAPDDGTTAPGSTAPDDGTAVPHRVVPLRRRAAGGRAGRRWRKPAAVAAAVLIAGGGIWAGLAATAGGPAQPLAACARPHACPQVTLTGTATHRTAAKVVIHDGVAWLEPARMPANPADEIYVLWQITGAPAPLAVGSFDVRAGAATPIRIGGLPAPYPRTRAFAVSLEHGRAIPARPSAPVAAGQVS
jgi:hypothetical protein